MNNLAEKKHSPVCGGLCSKLACRIVQRKRKYRSWYNRTMRKMALNPRRVEGGLFHDLDRVLWKSMLESAADNEMGLQNNVCKDSLMKEKGTIGKLGSR